MPTSDTAPDSSDEPDSPGTPGSSTEVRGPIPTNGLILDPTVAAQLQSSALSGDWAPQMAASVAGLEHLTYAVLCALGPDQSLPFAPGLKGYYELAPEWATDECGAECQNWVSACVLAHVNAEGNRVAISLRAPAIPFDTVDDAFSFQEAGFYGNLFTGDAASLEMFVCAGQGLLDDTLTATNDYLEGRLCFDPDCGFDVVGQCSAVGSPADGACATELGELGYEDCRAAGLVDFSNDLDPDAAPRVHEVVTVYIQPG